jgi:threonine synthase
MDYSEAFDGFRCTATGERYDPSRTGRSDAGAPLDPVYDLDGVDLDRDAVAAAGSLPALSAVLPFPSAALVTADEGGTPAVETPSVADELGVDRVVVKDESRNPTGTVLDRGMALAVTGAVAADADLLAHASPGNSGQSAAAYAGRAGLRSYAFVPSRAPFSNKAMINVHGGEMRVVGGRFPDALAAVDEQLEAEYHDLQEFTTPFRHEGAKTVAYELLADLGWTVPDAVVVPAGTGELVVGLAKGFRECRELGFVDAVPPVYAVQPSGCAPVASAHRAGRETTDPWETPDTIVGELEVPDPAGGDLALEALAATDGGAVTVDDDAILEAAVTLAGAETLEVGVAGGAAAAGAWALADAFDPGDAVALVNTESGTKTADVLRSHLMGKGI